MDRIYSPAENTSIQLIKKKRLEFAAIVGGGGAVYIRVNMLSYANVCVYNRTSICVTAIVTHFIFSCHFLFLVLLLSCRHHESPRAMFPE